MNAVHFGEIVGSAVAMMLPAALAMFSLRKSKRLGRDYFLAGLAILLLAVVIYNKMEEPSASFGMTGAYVVCAAILARYDAATGRFDSGLGRLGLLTLALVTTLVLLMASSDAVGALDAYWFGFFWIGCVVTFRWIRSVPLFGRRQP